MIVITKFHKVSFEQFQTDLEKKVMEKDTNEVYEKKASLAEKVFPLAFWFIMGGVCVLLGATGYKIFVCNKQDAEAWTTRTIDDQDHIRCIIGPKIDEVAIESVEYEHYDGTVYTSSITSKLPAMAMDAITVSNIYTENGVVDGGDVLAYLAVSDDNEWHIQINPGDDEHYVSMTVYKPNGIVCSK